MTRSDAQRMLARERSDCEQLGRTFQWFAANEPDLLLRVKMLRFAVELDDWLVITSDVLPAW